MSSMQSIDSEFGESRFSESSVQSDLPRQRKKKRSLMSKLRSKLSNSRGSDSEMSVSVYDLEHHSKVYN